MPSLLNLHEAPPQLTLQSFNNGRLLSNHPSLVTFNQSIFLNLNFCLLHGAVCKLRQPVSLVNKCHLFKRNTRLAPLFQLTILFKINHPPRCCHRTACWHHTPCCRHRTDRWHPLQFPVFLSTPSIRKTPRCRHRAARWQIRVRLRLLTASCNLKSPRYRHRAV